MAFIHGVKGHWTPPDYIVGGWSKGITWTNQELASIGECMVD